LQWRESKLTYRGVKQKLAHPERDEAWTKPDAYIEAMAFKRTFRRARQDKPRTQPEAPRLLLSTVPFLALLGLLAILAIAIAVIAFPGNQPRPKAKPVEARQQGVAQRGWFQEAQKEMHH
jgi:hypothetical protein